MGYEIRDDCDPEGNLQQQNVGRELDNAIVCLVPSYRETKPEFS